jgi:outer membrane autotransporter protein
MQEFHKLVNRSLLTIVLIITFLTISVNSTAQEIKKDTTETPFRKGRWFTGLAGSISSGTIENTSSGNKSSSNQYGIEIGTGKFIEDRVLVGFLFNILRQNFEGVVVKKNTEILTIGLGASYYFSKSKTGSLFFNLSPGFVVYRDDTSLVLEDEFSELSSKGNGFGVLSTLGYSYVLHDRISFDLGLTTNVNWLNVEQKTNPEGNLNNVNFVLSDLSFTFGFNVLLDQFFF